MSYDSEGQLAKVEEFVRWLGKASALKEVFPEYVLRDSTDFHHALEEIALRRHAIIEIAEDINPGVARRIPICVDDGDFEGAAIACQRLYLILEPEGHLKC